MNRRLIFISHSSRGEAWDIELRRHLRDALKARNYDVFLDEYDLSPADMWRPRVYRALTQCKGAVLMLSPDSLKSKWVLAEATILACRRDLHDQFDDAFKLLPVLLPGVTPVDLREAGPGNLTFDHLRLTDSQANRVEARDSVDAADAADEIAREFPKLPTSDDPMQQWTASIVGWLENVATVGIDAAARKLGISDEDWRPEDRKEILATALLHRSAATDPSDTTMKRSSWQLEEALLTLFDQGGRPEKGLFDKIAPISLPYATASRIVEALRYADGKRVIAINAEDPITAKRLVQRATCCDPKYLITEIPASQNLDGAYEEIVQALAYKYGDPNAWNDPEKFQRKLRGDFRARYQMVVLLKRGGRTGLRGEVLSKLLKKLRDDFGSVLFVVATGESEVQAADLGLDELLRIDPPLMAEQEEDVNAAIRRLENVIFPEVLGRSA